MLKNVRKLHRGLERVALKRVAETSNSRMETPPFPREEDEDDEEEDDEDQEKKGPKPPLRTPANKKEPSLNTKKFNRKKEEKVRNLLYGGVTGKMTLEKHVQSERVELLYQLIETCGIPTGVWLPS